MNKEVLDLHLAKAKLEVELKHMRIYLSVVSLVAGGVNIQSALDLILKALGK